MIPFSWSILMSIPKPGSITWRDLTVENAEQVSNFYSKVVGWSSSEVSMGDYSDFNMTGADAEPLAGICHARGANAKMPAQWLMYISVADLDESLRQCKALGGKVICQPRSMGSYGTMSVIADPAGAVVALMGPAE
jgi:predicted enzyme related to lactoylglutathione lyase